MTPEEIISKSKPAVLAFLENVGWASCAALERAVYEHHFAVPPPPHERGGTPAVNLHIGETMAQLQAEGRVRIDWTRDGHPWVLA